MNRSHLIVAFAEMIQQANAERLDINTVILFPKLSESSPPMLKPIIVDNACNVAVIRLKKMITITI